MSKFMLDVKFSTYVKREMNVMSKGGVEVCNPYGVATWHWCDTTFIESSVVKLDYGKVSTTDLSSFDIALWYTELQEMI